MSANDILFLQATDAAAYPPLINAAWLLADRGFAPTFLSAPIAGAGLAMPPIPNLRMEAIRPRPSHVMSKAAYAAYCARAIALAQTLRPSVVYASDPTGALPGLMAARGVRARLIYHEHDSPTREADLNPLVRQARRIALRSADRIVFPNAARAQSAAAETGFDQNRLEIVWNTPRRAEAVARAPARPHGRFVVYYHGSITPDRVPETVAMAVAGRGSGAVLRIAGYETPSGVGYVEALARRYGRADAGGIIEALGELPRHDLLLVASDADCALAMVPMTSTDINMRHMTGASNKAFDYMAAGLPILVSNRPDWVSMFCDPGHALPVDPGSAQSIGAALQTLMEDPTLRADMGARNRQKIEAEWNYDVQFRPVLDLIDSHRRAFAQ